MLSILCPHCREKLTIEEQWQGRTINCLSCGQQLAVPLANKPAVATTQPESPLVVSAPKTSIANRRRQRPLANRLISVGLHLSITLGAVYAGYYLISHRPKRPPQPATEIVELPKQAPATKSKPKQVRVLPSEPELPNDPNEIVETDPAEAIVEPPTSPFIETPGVVSLPAVDLIEAVTLIEGLSNPQLQLVSNTPSLSMQSAKVRWKDDSDGSETIATMSIDEGALNFRWSDSVPATAEAALRNSIIRLEEDDFQHMLSLRTAETLAPLKIDLGKTQQKIVGKFAHLTAPGQVYFELLSMDDLPAHTVDGAEPDELQIQNQTTLEYLEAPGAATRLKMTKRGKVAIVEIESRYVLPSGEEQPMSIAQGNKKLKQLDALHKETLVAETAIKGLRDRLKDLQRDAKAVPRSRATVLAKSQQLQRLQAEAVTVRQQIAYAERLITQKQVVAADQQAIQKIALLAQQLHDSRLSYRFFTVVDGHQVDLLIARE